MSKKFVIVKLLISIFIVTINGNSDLDCASEDGCCDRRVKGIDRLELNSTLALHEIYKGDLYILFGNKIARLHTAQLMKGKVLKTDEVDHLTMCGRYTVPNYDQSNNKIITGHQYGFGNEQIDFRCHRSEKENDVLICDYSHRGPTNYNEKVQRFTTYINNNSNVVVVLKCYPDHKTGWYVASNSPTIDVNEKKKVMDHVKALGFDPADVVPLHSEKC